MSESYDYIVVGAGSAGCLMANRLSANPANKVLLLEAGGKDNWIWLHVPVGYLYAIGNPRADWRFRTAPQPGLNGRDIAYPRGRVIGGCSAINGMIYMRGQARDYDGWRQLGLEGWGWDDVLPFFRKHEDHWAGERDLHGAGGEWRIERPRIAWDILDAVRDAAAEVGIPKINDFNLGDNEGSDYFEVNQRRGLRVSAAKAFLKPVLRRPNLRLVTGAHARRLLFEGGKVVGVEYEAGGAVVAAKARETVMTAGAIGTPHLLELSGVGRPEILTNIGVDVQHALAGVGENLQDHLQLRTIFRIEGARTLNVEFQSLRKRAWMGIDYALNRRGPLTMAPSQLGIFAKSSTDYETANLEFHVQPLSLDKFGDPAAHLSRHHAQRLQPAAGEPRLRPRGQSRSARAARSSNQTISARRRTAASPPISIRLARRIAAAPSLARYGPHEYLPGAEKASEAELAQAAGDIGTTIFHPVATCQMGRADDPQAVVDGRLRVRGLAGLRIADASVMPRITSGNTNSPTLMIAEKAAAMILEDAKAA